MDDHHPFQFKAMVSRTVGALTWKLDHHLEASMSELKSPFPAHMVVEALDTRLDMDSETDAGGGRGICNISGHCDW